MALYGGIEAGGTKFVCAIAGGPDDLRDEIRFPTTTPDETLAQAIDFFKSHQMDEPLQAIGVACFGPIDPNPASPTFGYVTTTPKPHWAHADVVGRLQAALHAPVGFDTDVNGAALGEHRWGAAQGLDTFVYLTIGTGLGGGAMVNGRLLHGMMHAEMGHMRIPHDLARDPYPGWCSYHGDCWEGLACGPAIEARWQMKGRDLTPDHPAWALEAHYLALGVANIIVTLSPQRIIMGGGVMDQQQIFPMVRKEVQKLLNGYVQKAEIQQQIDDYIVPPGLGNHAGVLGAIALAMDAAGE
ncbi:MAG: ROK family protein [Caldilinea sp.]|uniref:ROK family protein n=1 Tax=Caldilinea sp. TaxID=2293560 RepID=UPI002C964368|nr:ROK family protein [Anaerolineales bacterium]HQY92360.1 ROK family protein [Caldilinea sp.]